LAANGTDKHTDLVTTKIKSSTLVSGLQAGFHQLDLEICLLKLLTKFGGVCSLQGKELVNGQSIN